MNQSTTLVADQPDFWITEVEEESEEIDYYSEDDIIQSMNGYNVENESSSNDDNMNTGSSTFNHTKFTKYTLQKHLKLREYNPKIASLLPKCLIPNKTTKTLVDYSHRA